MSSAPEPSAREPSAPEPAPGSAAGSAVRESPGPWPRPSAVPSPGSRPRRSAVPPAGSRFSAPLRGPARRWAAVAAPLSAFGALLGLVVARWAPLARFDAWSRDGAHRIALAHGWVVHAADGFSAVGTSVAYLIVFVPLVAALLWQHRPRQAGLVALATIGSALLNSGVKVLVDRQRPVVIDPVAHAPGFSFPSGHAQAAMTGYLVLLVLVQPLVRGAWRALAVAVAAIMVLAIGASRVLLSVHYVSDVLAGYALGAAWTMFVVAVIVPSGQLVRRTEEP